MHVSYPLSIGMTTVIQLEQIVLAGLQWSVCLVYLDDIIIYSRSIAELLYKLQLVLLRLRYGGLKIKSFKCHCFKKNIDIISAVGIRTDPDKTAVIHQWPAPTNLKELQQCLGFASYRRLIKNFANIAAPLYKLTEKQTSWEWTSETNQAFHSYSPCSCPDLPTI